MFREFVRGARRLSASALAGCLLAGGGAAAVRARQP
jgi:hypothetical protein